MRRLFEMFLMILLCCASAIIYFTPAVAEPGGQGFTRRDDIVYVVRGKMPLMGDLYLPGAGGKRPALVLAHGGGFLQGDRKDGQMEEFARAAMPLGWVAFSVDYRLMKEGGTFPRNAQDVKCAVQWLRAHAKEFGVDPARIAVVGTSAGGYMASFVAVARREAAFNGSCDDPLVDKEQPDVALAVAMFGVHDWPGFKSGAAVDSVYFMGVKNRAEFKKRVSPISYAAQSPPMLLIHGIDDTLVPVQQSRSMCAALKAAGRDCTLWEYPGDGHDLVNVKTKDEKDFDDAVRRTIEWLKERFEKIKD
jgi:acetyl esterase/lipase